MKANTRDAVNGAGLDFMGAWDVTTRVVPFRRTTGSFVLVATTPPACFWLTTVTGPYLHTVTAYS